jgi:uncharacterized protein
MPPRRLRGPMQANAVSEDFNVLNQPLEECGASPVTGFYRDGLCRTDQADRGRHTVCAAVSDEFLQYSRANGNDLITPSRLHKFPGLVEGDRWCLCANRWLQAHRAGVAPPVYLSATHRSTLEVIDLDTLLHYALDKPAHS